MLVNKIRFFGVCTVVLHVKLHCQWIKIVEMRAKSVWWVRIRCFTPQFSPPKLLTKKHVNLSNFWDTLQLFFCAGVRLNPFWGILLQMFNGVPVLEQVDHMSLHFYFCFKISLGRNVYIWHQVAELGVSLVVYRWFSSLDYCIIPCIPCV